MKIRHLTRISFAALFVATTAPSYAAVTVLGTGLARSCFEYAEFGGNSREGIDDCTSAIDETALSPKDRAATLINRGILKSRTEDTTGALEDYDRGISLDANLGEAYVDRGAAYIVLRRYEDALADINRGITLGSNRMQIAYYDRAIVQEALGNIRGAYQDYKKATEIQPDFTLALEQLARFKVIHNQPDGT